MTATYVTGVTVATQKTHQFRSSLTGELSASGYTTGGQALTSAVINAATDARVFAAANVVYSSVSFTARGLIIHKRVGADMTTPADDPLICLLDFGSDIVSTAGTFTAQFNASGILQLS